VLATLSLVTVALWWAQKVLIPVALAMLLAFVLTPVVNWLQRRGLGRTPAAVVAVLFALALVAGVGVVIGWQLRDLSTHGPGYQAAIQAKVDAVLKTLPHPVQESYKEFWDPGQGPSPITWVVQQAALPATEVLASLALTIILVLFMLISREDLRNRVVRLLGPGHLVSTTRALDDSARRLSRYLLMQSCTNITVGVLLGVGLTLMGVPYALLWGFMAGILRFIPYAGTWSVAGLLALFCMTISETWTLPAMAFGYFAVIEILMSQVAEPLLFGHTTGVSPLALVIAITFWTWLWGAIGLMLAIPLTACLAVLGRHLPQLEFLDVLLGSEPVLDELTRYYQRLLARDQDEATDLVEGYVEKHPPETVYDKLLLPAIHQAKQDHERGELPLEDEQFAYEVTRSVLADVLEPAEAGTEDASPAPPETPGVLILGCPARDKADELALEMLRQLVQPAGRLEVLPAQTQSMDVAARVRQQKPALVVIGAVPPGGLAQTVYLAKRLRRTFRDLKILVGRWGDQEMTPRVVERLRRAGADAVTTTLQETRAQLVPLIEAAAAQPPQKEPALAGSR
jgi:predicted PurR-regulated permease PerM